jgi:hypothetical protein
MGRMYVCTFSAVAVTDDQDCFEIIPADDKSVIIHACYLSQSTDVGDAAEEMVAVNIIRGFTAGGSGGSAFTPLPLAASGQAAGFACEINNTTIATTGTSQIMHAEAFNIRAGWNYIPTPETRIAASQANTSLVVRILANPADSLTMYGALYVEELG